MAVLIPRIRTINVRLSDEEYLALERFCVASGARSISDLVRNTMNRLVSGANRDDLLASSVNEYSAHVKDLELKISELAAELESLRTGDRPHRAGGSDAPREIAEPQSQDDPAPAPAPAIFGPPPSKTDS